MCNYLTGKKKDLLIRLETLRTVNGTTIPLSPRIIPTQSVRSVESDPGPSTIPTDNMDVLTKEWELIQKEKELIARERFLIARERGVLEQLKDGNSSIVVPQATSTVIENRTHDIRRYGMRDILEVLPEFNPSDVSGLTSVRWVKRIETLMSIHNFEEQVVLLASAAKMKGPAR